MIHWSYFPRCDRATPLALAVVSAFEAIAGDIDSASRALKSNAVLALVRPGLEQAGFKVEAGKKGEETIQVPVLFGRNGRVAKSFNADAYHQAGGFVVEVEAGRGMVNNQFLKDLFQACMMHEVDYLAIAVRNVYKAMKNFETAERFFDTLYASNRLRLPLKGVLLIGY